MTRNHSIAVISLGLALAACGSHRQVVSAASPNPFGCSSRFVVAPVEFEVQQVGKKSEPEYLANKSEATKLRWEADKAAIASEFSRRLVEVSAQRGVRVVPVASPRAEGAFRILATVHFLEPGFFAGPAQHASEVSMTVTLESPQGELLDEIDLGSETLGSIVHASTRARFEHDAEELAEELADYLEARTGRGDGCRTAAALPTRAAL